MRDGRTLLAAARVVALGEVLGRCRGPAHRRGCLGAVPLHGVLLRRPAAALLRPVVRAGEGADIMAVPHTEYPPARGNPLTAGCGKPPTFNNSLADSSTTSFVQKDWCVGDTSAGISEVLG